RQVRGREVRKAAVPGGDVDPVALGVQLKIGKHRRIGVESRHLCLEQFGTGDANQSPAAAEFQHVCSWGDGTLVEIVYQHPTARRDLVPMERGLDRVVL